MEYIGSMTLKHYIKWFDYIHNDKQTTDEMMIERVKIFHSVYDSNFNKFVNGEFITDTRLVIYGDNRLSEIYWRNCCQ